LALKKGGKMAKPKPRFRELRRSYGFDEVAIVPGDVTINPDQTNIDFKVANFTFSVPILAAAWTPVPMSIWLSW
jgi:IMP dehydrogenase